jgi:hypothetical protein
MRFSHHTRARRNFGHFLSFLDCGAQPGGSGELIRTLIGQPSQVLLPAGHSCHVWLAKALGRHGWRALDGLLVLEGVLEALDSPSEGLVLGPLPNTVSYRVRGASLLLRECWGQLVASPPRATQCSRASLCLQTPLTRSEAGSMARRRRVERNILERGVVRGHQAESARLGGGKPMTCALELIHKNLSPVSRRVLVRVVSSLGRCGGMGDEFVVFDGPYECRMDGIVVFLKIKAMRMDPGSRVQ